MKVIHSLSKQIIDVPVPHAAILMGQGWKEHKEVKEDGLQEETKTTKEVVKLNKGKKNV